MGFVCFFDLRYVELEYVDLSNENLVRKDILCTLKLISSSLVCLGLRAVWENVAGTAAVAHRQLSQAGGWRGGITETVPQRDA